MLVLFLLLFEPCLSAGTFLTAEPMARFEWTHSNVLDPDGSFHLYWIPEDEWVVFEIQAKTTGYVGLGFSPHGTMAGADIVMSWVSNGEVHLYDYHSVGNQRPEEDEQQDYELLGGYENETHTMVRFYRKWITCDKDDNDLLVDTMHVIWSLGYEYQQLRDTVEIHKKRGFKSLYLKDPQDHQLPTLTDTKIWEVRANNVNILYASDTLYYCQTFRAPETDTKHYIIGFFPVISPGNEKHVHHMILYRCQDEISPDVFSLYTEQGYACYTENVEEMQKCDTIYIGWATGSTGTNFPETFGLPLGSEYGGSDYYLLEIHYDSTDMEEGVVDNSGLDVYYTDKLREKEGDTLTIGHSFKPYQLIPPGQTHFLTTGICGSQCIQQVLPEGGITIVSGLLHSHLAGRKLRIRHIRNKQELPHILKDDHFDFNYQETRLLNKEVTVLPGDELILECIYGTENRSSLTFGGLGINDEMCGAFLFYYPPINVSTCVSRPTDASLLKAVLSLSKSNGGSKNTVTEERPEELATSEKLIPDTAIIVRNKLLQSSTFSEIASYFNTSFVDIFRSVNFSNPDAIDAFQEILAYGPYQQICKLKVSNKVKKYNDTYPQFSSLPDRETSVCPTLEVPEESVGNMSEITGQEMFGVKPITII